MTRSGYTNGREAERVKEKNVFLRLLNAVCNGINNYEKIPDFTLLLL